MCTVLVLFNVVPRNSEGEREEEKKNNLERLFETLTRKIATILRCEPKGCIIILHHNKVSNSDLGY